MNLFFYRSSCCLLTMLLFFCAYSQLWNIGDVILCQAILMEDAQVVENILITHNLNPNKLDSHGMNNFLTALMIGSYNIINILIHHGAYIPFVYLGHTTAFHIASRMNNDQILKLLINYLSREDLLFLVNATDYIYNSPLHYAVFNQNSEIVKILIEHGADTNSANLEGNLPLHLASSKKNVEVLKLLLPGKLISWHELEGINLTQPVISISNNDYINRRNFMGNTPLHCAVASSSMLIINELLKAGADISIKDGLGRNALAVAQHYDRLMIQQFLSNYIDTNP